MLYAKVVLGIPVEGPFDYIVPSSLEKKIKAGSRVWVNFCHRKMLGIIVQLSDKTSIKKLKKISELIDDYPVLDKNMLSFTKELSEYYCCSWGEAIEAALPEGLRKGKEITQITNASEESKSVGQETVLLHDLRGEKRWDKYFEAIKNSQSLNKSAILIFPDKNSLLKAKERIEKALGIPPLVLYRKMPKELEEWLKIKEGRAGIIVGTLSGIFAPVNNLGLVIIDGEENSTYKQDQVPHYNVREAAIMRTKIEKAKLILASCAPSLESFLLFKKNKLKYIFMQESKDLPETKVVDMKSEYSMKHKREILSRYLHDSIITSLNSGEKILLFLNRKGFATIAYCHNCGVSLRCPRCNINLVYNFYNNSLNCHYCNFKMDAPKICPSCNSGYIKFSGAGTEKIESELSRLFPQAKIKRLDTNVRTDIKDADIFISTSAVIKQKHYKFGLIGVFSIDNSLNRIDFRSSEKTFALLIGLLSLTGKKLIIQTKLPRHYCFQSLIKNDVDIFYNEELNQRKQLDFPPYKHLGLVKLRGKNEVKVKEAALSLFEKLNKPDKGKSIKIISVNCAERPKLRGNFYWHVLASSADVKKLSKFLKINLKDFPHSGIIVTVDVDPL